MGREDRLDFAKLDPEASDLHLVVQASKKIEVARGKAPNEIARPVHPAAGLDRKRIGNEALGGEIGPVQVAARQAVACDI